MTKTRVTKVLGLPMGCPWGITSMVDHHDSAFMIFEKHIVSNKTDIFLNPCVWQSIRFQKVEGSEMTQAAKSEEQKCKTSVHRQILHGSSGDLNQFLSLLCNSLLIEQSPLPRDTALFFPLMGEVDSLYTLLSHERCLL